MVAGGGVGSHPGSGGHMDLVVAPLVSTGARSGGSVTGSGG
jgi:hypothetical protein